METHRVQVSIVPVADEWEVIISEGDRVAAIRFLIEEHARSFAGLQRVRLGLAPKTSRRPLHGEAGIIATCSM
jgi:hypothetical protein